MYRIQVKQEIIIVLLFSGSSDITLFSQFLKNYVDFAMYVLRRSDPTNITFKGTVQRDFRPPLFSLIEPA